MNRRAAISTRVAPLSEGGLASGAGSPNELPYCTRRLVPGITGEDAHDVETERPWLRVDIELHATLPMGQPIPMPKTTVWANWAREAVERLEEIEPLVPEDAIREGDQGLPKILAWQGEPTVEATCGADGELKLARITLSAWQAIELPRVWDDTEREPDDDPSEQLAAMFERVRAALHAWTEVLDHLR